MRLRSVRGIGLAAVAMTTSVLACARPSFRPSIPRRTEDVGVRAEIRRADLRHDDLDVDVGGTGAAPVALEGAWVESATEPALHCAGSLAARGIEKTASSGPSTSYRIHFDDSLLGALERPSRLALQVADGVGPARCFTLPLSGSDPALRWTFEPWGDNRPFAGRAIGYWFPVGGGASRYASGLDVALLRIGRWVGPLRLGGELGFGLTFTTRGNPNAMYEIPTSVFAEAFPIVAGHLAVGLGASYELRPSWFTNDSNRGFEIVHGPAGSVDLAYLPHRPLGFLDGPRFGTIDLSFSVSRWLPNGGATVLGLSFGINN